MSILTFVATGIAIYFAIALVLAFWPVSSAQAMQGPAVSEFAGFVNALSQNPDHQAKAQPAEALFFQARDGARRLYRLYPGASVDLLIFMHGSGSDSRYLARFAHAISQSPDGPTVATLDMRGHGPEPGLRRGDVDHVHQQEQDIADLWAALQQTHGFERFVLGGHSIGGGLSIRYACGAETPRPAGLLLIAPFIHRKSPAVRPGSGGWARPCVPRFAGIEMLGHFGVRALQGRPVLRFAVADTLQDGHETPWYSWRLYKSVTPNDRWQEDIAGLDIPVLLIAAENDVIFRSDGYPEIFQHTAQATVRILPEINHFQLSTAPEIPQIASAWWHASRAATQDSA